MKNVPPPAPVRHTHGHASHGLNGQHDMLARLETRLIALEAKLERVTSLVEQAVPMVAMTTDIVDEEIRHAAGRGLDTEAHVRRLLRLAEQLSAPGTAGALERILQRAEQIEQATAVLADAPHLLAATVDVADEFIRDTFDHDADGAHKRALLRDILNALTRVETLDALKHVILQLDKIGDVAKHADAVPDLIAMVVNIADEFFVQSGIADRNLHAWFDNYVQLWRRLDQLVQSAEISRLLESTILSSEAVDIVNRASNAAVDASQLDTKPIGAFGLLKALRDPNIQRSLGFLMQLLRLFGTHVPTKGQPKQLPAQ